ncbi:MAG: tetratricopeptide repeat protein [Candidatus Weimeria sp.]
MEKTEYKIKMDQVENLVRQGDLKEAVNVLDTLSYQKIRNVNVLLRASEIAEEAGDLEKSREILEIAHEKSPIARMIIYRLALISVKMGEFDEAETYYKEFVDIAPHDGLRFVIKYTIRKAQGADTGELIGILEDLCDEDFMDKWAFELACLYRKHGDEDKCTALCDKIALWFGEGAYVEKALEMKMMYKALTPEQEEQYRRITKAAGAGLNRDNLSDTITIPQVEDKPEKFDTVNLQAEIRKNIEEIMMATEAGEVSSNMDAIKELVGDIPYVTAEQTALEKHKAKHEDEKKTESATPIEDSYQQYLAEEYDGQLALNLPQGGEDEQVAGQLTISDVLEDWGKQKRAMEAALNDAKKKNLEKAKEKALREANQIMDRLVNISPQLEAGVSPEELLKEEYLNKPESKQEDPEKPILENADDETVRSAAKILEGVNDMLQHDIDTMSDDPGEEADELQEKKPVEKPQEEKVPEENAVTAPEEKNSSVAEDSDGEKPEEPSADDTDKTPHDTAEPENKAPVQVDDKTRVLDIDVSGLEKQIESAALDDTSVDVDYTDEEKAVLSYFVEVHDMKPQIQKALSTLKAKCESDGSIRTGNLTISGPDGSGKTALASKLVQITQKETGKLMGGAGRITGEKLNSKDLNILLSKVKGGSLMIEKAGGMNYKTAVSLSLLIENDRTGTLFILEDSEDQLKKLAAGAPKLWNYFTEHLSIPEMTLDELVSFGKVYVLECGYSMDDMGILALYDRIGMLQGSDETVCLQDVKDIIDEGIARNQKRSKGFFSHFSARMSDDDGRPMLQEKDIIE